MSISSIWHIDGVLSDTITPDQSGPVSDSNKRVLYIPQSSCITEASSSDCLVGGEVLPLRRNAQFKCQLVLFDT